MASPPESATASSWGRTRNRRLRSTVVRWATLNAPFSELAEGAVIPLIPSSHRITMSNIPQLIIVTQLFDRPSTPASTRPCCQIAQQAPPFVGSHLECEPPQTNLPGVLPHPGAKARIEDKALDRLHKAIEVIGCYQQARGSVLDYICGSGDAS